MRRPKFIVLALSAGVFTGIALVSPAGAVDAHGRGASAGGLTNALIKQAVVTDNVGDVIPTESVSLNLATAQDPEVPGVSPGGGGVEP